MSPRSIIATTRLEDSCPYKRLLVAVFTLAARDARHGDAEVCACTDREGLAVASLLIPIAVDARIVEQRLLTGA